MSLFERYRPGLERTLNDRACMLVMRNIAIYPQTFASRFITAESVLLQDDPNTPSRLKTGVGLIELAQARPRGEVLAPVVNKIHDKFGITMSDGSPFRLPNDTVEEFVRRGIHETVGVILDTTNEVRIRAGESPLELESPFIQNALDYTKDVPGRKARRFATVLHDHLEADPVVSEQVFNDISLEAKRLRADSHNQQELMRSTDYRDFHAV